MLGNDIVDLNHLPDAERSLSLPYLSKICSQEEIERILNSANPVLLLWRIWSMKESAYKISIKLGAERAFNPKKFETFQINETSGFVISDYGKMLCETKCNESFIHTVAYLQSTKSFKLGEKLEADNQSAAVRIALIEDYLSFNPEARNLEVIMQEGVPHLLSDSNKIDLSLSHHGSYISWVFELP